MKSLSDVKEQIKERADLAAKVGQDTKLFKTAQGYKACCPLPGHSEKTPSFNINSRDNYFYCYGCRRGGDIFTYLELTRGQPFMESLRDLAEEYHIDIQGAQFKSTEDSKGRDQSYELMDRVAKYFEETLHRGLSDGAKKAQEYILSRGYTLEELQKYRIGWAPESGTALAAKLKQAQMLSMAQELGLVTQRGGDFFFGRLMIPIEDHRGRVVAFSGRALGLRENEGPKYKNSPETRIFKKKEVLYGLNLATRRARELEWVCVVEGFFDAWAFDRVGVPSVAVMGVALGVEHLERLAKLSREVVLVLDNDKAGLESTKRSLPLLYEKDFEVKVFSQLGSKDPDEWLASKANLSKEEILKILHRSAEGMDWWALQLIQEARAEGLNNLQIIHRLEALWGYLKSPAHKRYWIRNLAPHLSLSEEQLAKHFADLKRIPPMERQAPSSTKDELAASYKPMGAEERYWGELVGLLLQYGSQWKNMAQLAEGKLLEELFSSSPLEPLYKGSFGEDGFNVGHFLTELKKNPSFDSWVAKAHVSVEESSEANTSSALSAKAPLKSLRELAWHILKIRKENQLKKLSIELKNKQEAQDSAQILHVLGDIQKLRREMEDLKVFANAPN
jgi:DNA primase catalytic core